ncbi:MAG: hypothetical protein FJ034_00775 [Chloroflexi bacterium]|nr:hypothetical protein [Chloroflexota bacterium]
MPTYDYECDHCGNSFHATVRFTDPPLAACPRCGKEPRKVFAAPAIVFKGSGWYKTDSRPKSDGGGSSKPADGDGGAKVDTKTETKSEAKSETKSATSSSDKAGSGTPST